MAQQSRLSGAIALIVAQTLVLILGYVTHIWIGRILGPGPYGVYGVILSIQTIIGLFLTLGLPVAVSRFVAQDPLHAQAILKQGLRWQLIIGVLVAGITIFTSPLLAHVLNDTSLTPLIAFTGIIILSQSWYPVFTQFLSGMHAFNRQAALTSLYAVAKLVGALALISTFSVYGAFAGFGIGGLFAAIIGWRWTRHYGSHTEHLVPVKAFFSFAGMYVVILVGVQILISLDLFMVKALLADDVQAGYYNAAVTLSRISYFLLQALAFIILPSVSALTKPGESHLRAVTFIRDTVRYLIALIVPSIALAAATSRNLITLFFSKDYLPAAPALTILMIGVGSLAFYLLLTNIVAGAGKAKVGLWITGGLLIVSVGLGLLLIKPYGLRGAAWQTTITGILGLTLLAAYTFKTFAIPIPWRSTINIFIATAVATSLTYIWTSSALLLPILYLICGVIYITTLLILGEVSPQDRAIVARLHPKLRWLAPSSL